MYSCANGYIIYGWCECGEEFVIDENWLNENDISLYCSYQVKGYASGKAIYGLNCIIDVNTGEVNIDEIQKRTVQEAYTKYVIFRKENNFEEILPLGYYIGIDGDMNWEPYSIRYIDIDDDSDDNDSDGYDSDGCDSDSVDNHDSDIDSVDNCDSDNDSDDDK